MRTKSAIAAAVLGAIILFFGIGLATFWAPPATVTATLASGTEKAPVTILDPSLKNLGGDVSLKIKSETPFTLNVGQSDDVKAWVGKAANLEVTGADAVDKSLKTTFTDGEKTVPNPADSDLWVSTQNGSGELTVDFDSLPKTGNWTFLLASDGTAAAPATIEATFENPATNPWAVPLIVLGAAILLAALSYLFLFGKGSRKPRTAAAAAGTAAVAKDSAAHDAETPAFPAADSEPKEAESTKDSESSEADDDKSADDDQDTDDDNGTSAGDSIIKSAESAATEAEQAIDNAKDAPKSEYRQSGTIRRRASAILAAVGLGATGLFAGIAPSHAEDASPSPSAAADSDVVIQPKQLERIVEKTATAIAAADASRNAKDLESRVTGAALTIRTQNYKIRASAPKIAPVAPMSGSKILTSVTTSNREWPRNVVVLTQGAENPTALITTLRQDGPRDNYKMVSSSYLLPGSTFPAFAKSGVPDATASADDARTKVAKDSLNVLVDKLNNPTGSNKDAFGDNTYVADTLAYQAQMVKDSPEAKLTFSHSVVDAKLPIFGTSDGGTVVVGLLDYKVVRAPKEDGVTLVVSDDATAALLGTKSATKAITNEFLEPVVLYVGADGSTKSMQLVGADRFQIAASIAK